MAKSTWIRELVAGARPFVTRSLRGGRARRFAALAWVLLIVTVVCGTWLARGAGALERDFRTAIGAEIHRSLREQREFVVFADSDAEHAMLTREVAQQLATPISIENRRGRDWIVPAGVESLRDAVLAAPNIQHPNREDLLTLQHEAAAVLAAHSLEVGPSTRSGFSWDDANDVVRVRSIIDRDLIPEVVRYQSPLDATATLGLVGLMATLLALVLVLVVAPVLAGIAAAQEAHENTLQPLAGTALRPRQLALGLAIGATAPVLILAAPLMILGSIAALATGGIAAWLALVALAACCAWALALLAQATGLFAGRKRTPAPIAVSLLAVLSTWLLVGLATGFDELGRDNVALITLLPSGAITHLARWTFDFDAAVAPATILLGFYVGVAAAAFVAILVGGLGLLATERRILGRYAPALRQGEALLGAGFLAAIILLALSGYHEDEFWFVGLALLVMPLQIFLMGRVPHGDAPNGTPTVAVAALVGEFWAMIGIYAAIALVARPSGWVTTVLPSTIEIGYALTISALVALRVVAVPAKLGASIWAGFAFVFALICFGVGIARSGSANTPLLVLAELHPILGGVQVALYVVIPWTLITALTPRPVAVATSMASPP